jgi:GTP diphosphokinase / guanosine-3',5'-bis(diphosphate) 3'-diphosphatase
VNIDDEWLIPMEPLLAKAVKYISEEEIEQLKKAILLAEQAHQGQMRKSREPYIVHPLAVAGIVADLQLDVVTLIAAVLHDVVEDTGVTLEQIEAEFGPAVRQLVDGVTKLTKMEFASKEAHQAENHRKMFVAMAQDFRVILIKLADRLHNLRTLRYMPEYKQRQKAKETLEIFAPLAHRLGISKMRWELEDIALRYLDPQQYYRIVHLMKKKRAEREEDLQAIIQTLCQRLQELEIKVADISGRPKHIYSIYKKMVSQQKAFNEIYDLMAVRVIVHHVRDCYAVLGMIHTMWKPMPGRFKDYIAMPKTNMYQSLHTTVIGPKGEPIEVQIRTFQMHRTAEYGIAAHWTYKEGDMRAKMDGRLKWFREVMELQQETKDAQEFVESLKMDLFSDVVFVFTPKGEVMELPIGSVPLDFAFRIHTEVGYRCVGAKVNGKMVPLDYRLQTGDIVDILTSKHSYGPSQDWLKLVKSSHARSKIRSWFKKQRREESIEKGKEMVELLLQKHHLPVHEILVSERIAEAVRKFSFQDDEDLFAAVGYGGISTAQVVHRLIDGYKPDVPVILPKVKTMPRPHQKQDQGVRVKGVENLLVRLSRCCHPIPGDEIVGYVTQGRGVTVHRCDCPNLAHVLAERRIEVEWESRSNYFYVVDLEISGLNRSGLLNEVLQVVHDSKTNLAAVSAKGDRRGIASIHLQIGIRNMDHLQSVVERVKQVRDIYSVQRIMQ